MPLPFVGMPVGTTKRGGRVEKRAESSRKEFESEVNGLREEDGKLKNQKKESCNEIAKRWLR